MMTKQKSKQIKQLKYLLLIPLLISMLVYTSCNETEAETQGERPKGKMVFYSQIKEIQEIETEKDTYLDLYLGTKEPAWKEISYDDLTREEKEESKRKPFTVNNNKVDYKKKYYIHNGRKVVATIFNYDSFLSVAEKFRKTAIEKREVERLNGTDVPFSIIEEVPVYPGCTGTREQKAACLNKNIKKFVAINFNISLAKDLKLSKGKKKVWVVFRIDKEGNIVDVNARAPHPKLKEEAIRVVNLLPKMKPGKQRGKTVGMKYTLPISFNIE